MQRNKPGLPRPDGQPRGTTSHSGKMPAGAGRLSLPYLPGLDGLRAIAITAVLLYHADVPWLAGGFLGVEVFFVLSGYLLASLLLAEWRATGRVDARAFWFRRARRLLPALYVLLAVMLCGAALVLPAELARLRSDSLAALTFATNWYLVFNQQSYFEAVARPSLLQHLWSLAVEEQFYLLLPLALGLLLSRRRQGVALVTLLAAALASSIWMALLYRPGVDPSRVYYGVDTRAAGLLLGTALAFVWRPRPPAARTGRGWLVDATGIAALLILVWCFAYLHAYAPALYRGGFALVGLATALLIGVVVDPRARLGTHILGRPLLRWIGRRSYSIYLWHWPVFMLTRPQLDLPIGGWPLLVVRLAITLLLAEASYRFVELPLRYGGLRRSYVAAWWRLVAWFRAALSGASVAERRVAGAVWIVNAGFAVLVSLAIVRAVSSAQSPPAPAYLAVRSINTARKSATVAKGGVLVSPAAAPSAWLSVVPAPFSPATADGSPSMPALGSATLEPPTTTTTAAAPTASPEDQPPAASPSPAPPTALPGPPATATEQPAPAPPEGPAALAAQPEPAPEMQKAAASETPTAPPPETFGRVGAVGDSVMLSAAAALQGAVPGVQIDAEVSRQVDVALWVLQSWQAGGQLGDVAVVHIGNNGVFLPEQFDALMQALSGVPRVYVLTVKVPRPWEGPNNAVIVAGVARYPNTRLIDWHAASVQHPEYFWDDGIHLRPEGAAVYAELVRAQLGVEGVE